jgi:hypothetical protein
MPLITARIVPLVALAAALSSLPARAEIPLDEAGTISLFGDFRFRVESDWDSQTSAGTERDDRDRARVRLRLGFRWEPTEHVSFEIQGRSGNTNSQQSPHVTILQSGDNGDHDALVDRVFVKFKRGPGWAWVGRNGHPFWRQNEHLFDDDVWLDGVGFGFDFGEGKSKHRIRGAYAAVPEGDASLSWNEQGFLGGLQYVFERALKDGNVTVALGHCQIDDDEDVDNPVLLDEDYGIWMLSVQRAFRWGELPVTLGADIVHDADPPDKDVFNHDQQNGFVVSAQLGSLKEKGDWTFGYWYAQMEKFAVVPYLAQDDWLRWGSATQTRSSNYELRFGYAITKKMNVVARLYHVDGLELESPDAVAKEDGNRFRVDFNWKF